MIFKEGGKEGREGGGLWGGVRVVFMVRFIQGVEVRVLEQEELEGGKQV